MIRVWSLIRSILEPKTYIWVNVTFVRETPKAILIIFDDRKAWIPKAWLCRIKRNKGHYVIVPKMGETRLLAINSLAVGQTISIQLSEYHWVRTIK